MEYLNAIKGFLIPLFDDFFSDYTKDIAKIAIGWAADRGYLAIMRPYKAQLNFLGAKANDKWTLYYGNVKEGDNRIKAREQTNQEYIYGDIEATLIAGEVFGSWLNKSPEYSRYFLDDDHLNDVILSVGGPKWNKITERLIGAIGSPVKYVDGKKGLIFHASGELKCPYSEDGNNRIINDVGVILVTKSSFFKKHPLGNVKAACVIMGYSTYGVRLAAEFIKTINADKNKFKQLLKNNVPVNSERFCILVHGKLKIVSDGEVNVPLIDSFEVITDSLFVDPYINSY